jgi:chromosome segregation ATPase
MWPFRKSKELELQVRRLREENDALRRGQEQYRVDATWARRAGSSLQEELTATKTRLTEEQKRANDILNDYAAVVEQLLAARKTIKVQQELLAEASKNDQRGPDGRFMKAGDE